jgi:hypothetical protein
MPSDQEDLDWQKMILHAALELRENSQNCPTSVSGIRKTILGDNVLTESEIVLGLPDFEIIGIERKEGNVIPGRGSARIAVAAACGVRAGFIGPCGSRTGDSAIA